MSAERVRRPVDEGTPVELWCNHNPACASYRDHLARVKREHSAASR